MDTDETRAALDAVLAAFAANDSDRLAGLYDEDIDWLFHCPVTVFPFAGVRRGKADVFAGYQLFYRDYKVTSYDVCLKMADGDRASTISESQAVQRATGRIMRSRVAGFHRFRDGKLIEYRGFTDSFDAAEQILGHEISI